MTTQHEAPIPASAAPVEIERRDLRFELADVDLSNWHPGGLHVSHFFNALSVFFPDGEKFFIDAVRHYRDRIDDPKLRADAEDFVAQEAIHGREHRAYNHALDDAGLPVRGFERFLQGHLSWVRKWASPADRLAITIALEHYTAILAQVMLSRMDTFEGGDPEMASIWRWHAIEETEHKSVAFDVYRQVVGTGFAAYLRRSLVMLQTTVIFWSMVGFLHLRFVAAEGRLGDVRGWWRLIRFHWIEPGGLRRIVIPWLDYFRPGFHPWQHDNRHHVEAWKADYAAEGRAPA